LTYADVIDGPDFETSRVGSQDLLLEILNIVKAIISDVGRFAQSEREFPVRKEL
jgi:hypothetical protein